MAKSSPIMVSLAFFSLLSISSAFGDGGSIHDLLRAHGLPAGLFPKAVDSFAMDPDTGLLEVRLDRPCYAKYDGNGMAYFDRVVRGNLSYGGLRGMEGLSQEELFLWFPVKGIVVTDQASGVILFDIGLAHKQLSLSLFEIPPECRPEGGSIAGGGPQDRIVGLQDQR